MLQLDFTGAYGVLAAGPDVHIHLVWHDLEPILSSDGLPFTPTRTFADCPALDVIAVPGGGGVVPLLSDTVCLDFLRKQAITARYAASVCTGALVLGAAGLLFGYRATTHWLSHDLLAPLGAIPETSRVVLDRNRITAAGVTSGIDMALTLAAKLWDEATAQAIQLNMEYAPEPPFASGSPETAPEAVVQNALHKSTARQKERKDAVMAAAARLHGF